MTRAAVITMGRRPRRIAARAMTLIEIMVVMVLVALVLGAAVLGNGQMAGTGLKHTATSITGAVRVAFTRATATSRAQRIVFDLDEQQMWLEQADAPMLIQTKDTTGTGGADPVTEAEKRAVAEGERLIKGPQAPRAFFKAVDAFGAPGKEGTGKGPRALDKGLRWKIAFKEIQTAHDDAPRTSGRAYLYFWPGGLTERAAIQIRAVVGGRPDDDNETMTLVVSPLTGKVTVKTGAVALAMPVDEKDASEREDTGGGF